MMLKIIAAYNNFMPAYAEKCLLMASMTFASSMTGSSNWVDVLDLATKLSEDFDAMDGKLVR